MYETAFASIKTLLLAIILTPFGLYTGATFGIYTGAITIAMVAALSRLAYTKEKLSCRLFFSFYTMSLSITLIFVHVGKLNGWGMDTTIIISGVSAFLGKEFLDVIMSSKELFLKHLIRRLK